MNSFQYQWPLSLTTGKGKQSTHWPLTLLCILYPMGFSNLTRCQSQNHRLPWDYGKVSQSKATPSYHLRIDENEAASLSIKHQRAPLQSKISDCYIFTSSLPIFLLVFSSIFVRFIEQCSQKCPTDNSQLRVGPPSSNCLKSLTKALLAVIGWVPSHRDTLWSSMKHAIKPMCPLQSVSMGKGGQQPLPHQLAVLTNLVSLLSFPYFLNASLSFISFFLGLPGISTSWSSSLCNSLP